MAFRGMRANTLLAGAVATATAALLLSGCGAGQIAETANKVAAVPGASGEVRIGDARTGGLVSVRNAVVVYDGPEGYEKGASAPLDIRIFNDTQQSVTVRISSPESAESVAPASADAATPAESPSGSPAASASASPSVTPVGSPSASPSPSASEPAAPARPATVEIPAGEYVVLTEAAGEYLRLVGLKQPLKPGEAVEVVFDFGGGQELKLPVPVGIPLTPVPRASAEVSEEEH
ncbi:hypothetical protein WEI85_07415 [Actinomycetes bacterium KLBMP 9797]